MDEGEYVSEQGITIQVDSDAPLLHHILKAYSPEHVSDYYCEGCLARSTLERPAQVKHIYCTQPPHAEVTKLLCPHHEGACAPHPIRAGGPDLWYQPEMALVDTTVEQSLISSAGGDEGVRGCARCVVSRQGGVGGGGGGGCAAQ